MDRTELIRSLMSAECPACRKTKNARQTFCNRCYFKLNKKQRSDLYKTVDNGYEEAFSVALNHLHNVGVTS